MSLAAAVARSTSLESLLEIVRSHEIVTQEDEYAMTNLPTFGGTEPASTLGIFSWDATRLLVQRPSGLVIEARE